MKTTLLFCLAITLLAAAFVKPTRVVFFGDSITFAGVQPGGYIERLKTMLPAD